MRDNAVRKWCSSSDAAAIMPRLEPEAELQRDLIPVNAVIGFLRHDRRWPSALYSQGYQLCAIEQPITAPPVGTAEIDVICISHRENHAILWECKSGKTVDEKQAQVYAAVTAEDVQRTGNVTFRQPASASVEPAYCCLAVHEAIIVDALRGWGLDIPVVSLGERARLASGRLRDASVHTLFATGFPLPPLEEVPRFLPANAQTPKEAIATLLFATLVSFLRKQRGRFSVRDLLRETFPDWYCMGTDLRKHFSSLGNEIVVDLCENELRDFAQKVGAKHSPGEILVEFSVGVVGLDPSARTRTFQRLARLAEGYRERLKERRPYEPGREPESMWLPGFGPESH